MPPVPAAPTSTAPGRAPPAPVTAPTTAPAPDAAPEAAEAGPSFELRLGDLVRAIPLVGEAVTVTRDAYTVDLRALGVALPGVEFERLRLRRGADRLPTGGTLSGAISVPFVRGRAELTVDANGDVSGTANARFDVEVLGRPQVTFSYVDRRFRGSVTVEAGDLRLPIPNVTVDEGRATVTFDGEALTGSLSARFHHAALGNGNISVTIASAGIEGTGAFTLTMPLLAGSHGTIAVDRDGRLSADATLTTADVQAPIPGLSITSITGNVALREGHVSGTVGLSAAYAGLANLTIAEVALSDRGFRGANGSIEVTAPAFQGSRGTLRLDAAGRPSGEVTIAAEQIPIPALRRGRVTIRLRPDGGVDVSGSGRLEIAPVGGGDFTVGWENGVLSIGADVQLTVPGLQPVTGRLDWRDGDLSGEVRTGITVGTLTGTVLLRYAQQQFSGEGRLDYSAGRFSGWVLVRVDPQAVISGEGEATVRFTDNLTGTIGLTVLPDLNVDARGEIVFASSIELFPAWRFERSFFNFRESFPLWGIRIPVVGSIGIIAEIRASAGFRAAFGPGTFGNIRAEGEISTRPEAEPTFSISGDLVIPAGAEIVLSVGGGIGLAALIAEITGGINLEGIAGVYGALTLTPTFAYTDGEYRLRGDALLAAVAQLRARINAYASVVAGIGWFSTEVWRRDWNLAEWRFDTGWQVGMRAGIEWVVGQPFVPDVELQPVDVDPQAIIRGAIPNSGEPVPAPPAPPAPVATFTPSNGSAAPAASAAGGPAPTEPAAVPATPSPATAPAAPGVPGAPSPEGAPAAPAAGPTPPQIDPPAAQAERPEEREVEEQYLVYVYDNLRHLLQRKRAPTAPTDEELKRRRAVEPPLPGDTRSPGRPLPPSTRAEMESALDTDLSDVRVHTDETARAGAEAIGAEAYAAGSDIYFAPSRSVDDKELLAHELTHVAQGEAPAGEAVAAPDGDAEQEAEAVARSIARDEQPDPVKKRREAEVHRQADQPAPAPTPAPHVAFTEERLRQILATPGGPTLAQALAALISLEAVRQAAASEVYVDSEHKWKKRETVDMPFPVSAALPHKGLFGDVQVKQGDIWLRHGQARDTDIETPQGQLASLMAASPGRGFTSSPHGTWDRDEQFPVYQNRPGYTPLYTNISDAALSSDPADTNSEERNLNLKRPGYDAMWAAGWDYHGSLWWRRGGVPAGGGPESDLPEPETQARLAADYQAHHVIPLWLHSETTPSGDIFRNLAPWRRDRHQVNHAVHHRVPPEVSKVTGATNYVDDFPTGTRFRIARFEGGTPSDPNPRIRLDPSDLTGWRRTQSQGPPLWWGD